MRSEEEVKKFLHEQIIKWDKIPDSTIDKMFNLPPLELIKFTTLATNIKTLEWILGKECMTD